MTATVSWLSIQSAWTCYPLRSISHGFPSIIATAAAMDCYWHEWIAIHCKVRVRVRHRARFASTTTKCWSFLLGRKPVENAQKASHRRSVRPMSVPEVQVGDFRRALFQRVRCRVLRRTSANVPHVRKDRNGRQVRRSEHELRINLDSMRDQYAKKSCNHQQYLVHLFLCSTVASDMVQMIDHMV